LNTRSAHTHTHTHTHTHSQNLEAQVCENVEGCTGFNPEKITFFLFLEALGV
jgi:hypothetical protein